MNATRTATTSTPRRAARPAQTPASVRPPRAQGEGGAGGGRRGGVGCHRRHHRPRTPAGAVGDVPEVAGGRAVARATWPGFAGQAATAARPLTPPTSGAPAGAGRAAGSPPRAATGPARRRGDEAPHVLGGQLAAVAGGAGPPPHGHVRFPSRAAQHPRAARAGGPATRRGQGAADAARAGGQFGRRSPAKWPPPRGPRAPPSSGAAASRPHGGQSPPRAAARAPQMPRVPVAVGCSSPASGHRRTATCATIERRSTHASARRQSELAPSTTASIRRVAPAT